MKKEKKANIFIQTLFYKHRELYVIEAVVETSFLKYNELDDEDYIYAKDLDIQINKYLQISFKDIDLLLIKRVDLLNNKSICRFIFNEND